MKRLLVSMLFFLAGACWVSAGDADADLAALQGTWEIASLTEQGKAVPKAEIDNLSVVISKDTYVVNDKTAKENPIVIYRIKLDPSKSPKTIDFTHLAGESKDKTEPGIYAIEKDQIKLVLNEERKGRPTVFEGKETADYSVLVLKKKAAAKAK